MERYKKFGDYEKFGDLYEEGTRNLAIDKYVLAVWLEEVTHTYTIDPSSAC